MNNILRFVKAKKYLISGICIAIILVVLNAHYFVKADEAKNVTNNIIKSTVESAKEISKDFSIATLEDTVPINLLHADCVSDLVYGTTPSSTFNPNNQYVLSFVSGPGGTEGGLNGFYDINGDNLPDYIYTSNQTFDEGSNVINSTFISCVYLNNGTGWTEEYRCRANTRINKQTGTTVSGEYYGDCKG